MNKYLIKITFFTAEALGVSVAPSFFHTCVSTGKTAKMEDVERFKVSFSHFFCSKYQIAVYYPLFIMISLFLLLNSKGNI